LEGTSLEMSCSACSSALCAAERCSRRLGVCITHARSVDVLSGAAVRAAAYRTQLSALQSGLCRATYHTLSGVVLDEGMFEGYKPGDVVQCVQQRTVRS
jgi:hypothetical protein